MAMPRSTRSGCAQQVSNAPSTFDASSPSAIELVVGEADGEEFIALAGVVEVDAEPDHDVDETDINVLVEVVTTTEACVS
jgi:hypothetical protein